MKRFLKEGKITCQEEKASVCLAECLFTFFFKYVLYSHRISCKDRGLCEHVHVVISFMHYSIKHVHEGRMGLHVLSKPT